ncbi:hypothetical protein Hanom_Chr06g00531141 [Helianthus anomalus]
MKRIEETPKEKSRAFAVIQDDEGFDWSEFLPDEDVVSFAFIAKTEQIEEETTYIRRKIMAQHMKQKIYEAWKEAKRARRYDPDRECYLDPKGNICVEPSSVDVETLIKSISETEEQKKIDAAKESRERKARIKVGG